MTIVLGGACYPVALIFCYCCYFLPSIMASKSMESFQKTINMRRRRKKPR